MAGKTIRHLMVRLGLDTDASGANRFTKSLDNIAKNVNKLDRNIRSAEKRQRLFIGSLVVGGAAATKFGGSLLTLAGAAGTTLPAALAGAGAAALTFKVGLQGTIDTLDALFSGNGQKFAKLYEQLGPDAKALVDEIDKLNNSFANVKDRVEAQIFKGLREELGPLADTYFPHLEKGMLRVGVGFNQIILGVTRWLKSAKGVAFVNRIFDQTAIVIYKLGENTEPLLDMFAKLAELGLDLTQQFVDWTINGTKAAMAFVQSEKGATLLAEKTALAKLSLEQLGRISRNLGSFLASAFHQAESDSGRFLDVLERLTAKWAAWAKTIAGQEKMRQFFQTLEALAKGLLEALPLLLGPLGAIVKLFTSLPEGLQGVIAKFGAFAILAGMVGARLGGIGRAALTTVGTMSQFVIGMQRGSDALSNSASTAAKAGAGFRNLYTRVGGIKGILTGAASALAGPWGIALAAGTLALGYFAMKQQEAEQEVRDLTASLDKQTGAITDQTREMVISKLQQDGLIQKAKDLGVSLDLMTRAALGDSKAFKELNDFLNANHQVMSTVTTKGGTFATGQKVMSSEAKTFSNAIGDQNSKMKEAFEAHKLIQSGLKATGRETNIVADETQNLIDKMDRLINHGADADRANIQYAESLQRMREEANSLAKGINKTTGAIDINRAAGRRLQLQTMDLVRSIDDEAKANLRDGKSVFAVKKEYDKKIDSLRRMLEKMGMSREEINRLIGRYSVMKNAINDALRNIKDKTVRIKVTSDGTVHLPKGLKASLFARGGVLPGHTPGRDVHTFYSPTGGVLGLSGGESIFRPEFTDAVGKGWVDHMNYIARVGGAPAVKKELDNGVPTTRGQTLRGEGMFFADGGVITKGQILGVAKTAEFLKNYNRRIGNWSYAFGAKLVKKINELGVGGPAIQRALRFAKAQAGKPYIWGGVGPRGFDCSGFMSAIWNVIKGKNPYSRVFTTHIFKGSAQPFGFRRNAQSGFKIGVTHAGVGHMAGTLGRTNVESRGSRGVLVGPAARGWNNGLFPYRYGLKMDDGGVLPPKRITPVYNGTNRNEYAIPERFLKGERGGDHIEIHIHAGVGSDPNAIKKAVYDAIKQYKLKNGRSLGV